jgi:hypothetical protein
MNGGVISSIGKGASYLEDLSVAGRSNLPNTPSDEGQMKDGRTLKVHGRNA